VSGGSTSSRARCASLSRKPAARTIVRAECCPGTSERLCRAAAPHCFQQGYRASQILALGPGLRSASGCALRFTAPGKGSLAQPAAPFQGPGRCIFCSCFSEACAATHRAAFGRAFGSRRARSIFRCCYSGACAAMRWERRASRQGKARPAVFPAAFTAAVSRHGEALGTNRVKPGGLPSVACKSVDRRRWNLDAGP